MIEVRHLSKRFVGRAAVDDITFSVGKGEVVGFLGPNGAGKTTTMRMLTGYLPPSSGAASVAGYDIFSDSLKARREIGYMPESVPLYDDMRTEEYLKFRAALKGLRGRAIKENLLRVMDLTGLRDVARKMVSSLSKGYRQRLGLADALIHKPRLLVLDEPTNGLDPNQIRQVRNLITQLSSEHTILLSTHILSEVQMTCRRVIIIHRGKIRADDSPDNLARSSRSAGTVTMEIKAPEEAAIEKLQAVPGVRRVTPLSEDGEWHTLEIKPEPDSDIREEVSRVARENHWPLRELSRRQPTLEDVFVEITQRD
jgi:ABC-2 type transport system ATP-binding protein